jgi:acetolactate synthase small subunit
MNWNIEIICSGNLEKLKEIHTEKITEEISNKWIEQMEKNIQEIDKKIQVNQNSTEIQYITTYWIEQKQKIENCILYLKKIK